MTITIFFPFENKIARLSRVQIQGGLGVLLQSSADRPNNKKSQNDKKLLQIREPNKHPFPP